MIDPEKLGKRLEEVWATLGRQADADGHEVMRACALTLIAVVDATEAEATAETLAELMRDHPSRAIVVLLGEDEVLEADVEARCWMPFGGRRQICSEQIAIRCSEKTIEETPGVILPLLAPDLPVVLWCASERAARARAFASLAAPAGRVLLDSQRYSRPLDEPGSLTADLSWTRLTRWRALLAQLFENELYRQQLPRISQVTIWCEGEADTPVPRTALLLGGWLLPRLGGLAEDNLRLLRGAGACRPARLAALELSTIVGPVFRIRIARTGESGGEVLVELAGREPVLNRVSLPRSTDVLLLGEELSIQAPDPIFQQSRDRAAGIRPDWTSA